MNKDASLPKVGDKDRSNVDSDYVEMRTTMIKKENDNIYSQPATSAAGRENIYSIPTTSVATGENVYSTPIISAVGSNDYKKIKKLICILVVIASVIATLALIAGCFVAVFLEISSLKSERATQDQTPLSQLMANDSSIMHGRYGGGAG